MELHWGKAAGPCVLHKMQLNSVRASIAPPCCSSLILVVPPHTGGQRLLTQEDSYLTAYLCETQTCILSSPGPRAHVSERSTQTSQVENPAAIPTGYEVCPTSFVQSKDDRFCISQSGLLDFAQRLLNYVVAALEPILLGAETTTCCSQTVSEQLDDCSLIWGSQALRLNVVHASKTIHRATVA